MNSLPSAVASGALCCAERSVVTEPREVRQGARVGCRTAAGVLDALANRDRPVRVLPSRGDASRSLNRVGAAEVRKVGVNVMLYWP